MIPILYEKTETAFVNNGLGRLRDCISAVVTEERNGIFELDFEYPTTGANFELIQVGRIVAVTHDDTSDVEPFDIVSYTRPINGVVTFHCTHISYRLSYCTVTGSNINSLADAFTLFGTAEPSMPFTFQTDKTSSGYMAAADGTPRTVRELMGGVEGSVLDAYGGEYAFNNWNVYLYAARGQFRDFTIRYGVNMLNYDEEYDSSGTFSSVIPYWTDGNETVVGDRVDGTGATITGRGECVPLDLSDKFESKPTKAQVETEAAAYLNTNNTTVPKQTIKIEFVRLQDMGFDWLGNLLTCELCDTIKVIFPDYNASGNYKIVKIVWDVLADRFESMELGELSTTLAEALGITNGLGGGGSQIDSAMSDTSENAVENKVIKAYVDSVPTLIYTNAYSSGQAYKKTGINLAGSTYLGQDINLGSQGDRHPIFNGFDISGTGTARIHTLGHYIYKSGTTWYAYVKMRNDNTSAVNGFTLIVYIAWI